MLSSGVPAPRAGGKDAAHLQAPLFWRSVVHTAGNDVPPTVDVSKVPSEDGRSRRQCQLMNTVVRSTHNSASCDSVIKKVCDNKP